MYNSVQRFLGRWWLKNLIIRHVYNKKSFSFLKSVSCALGFKVYVSANKSKNFLVIFFKFHSGYQKRRILCSFRISWKGWIKILGKCFTVNEYVMQKLSFWLLLLCAKVFSALFQPIQNQHHILRFMKPILLLNKYFLLILALLILMLNVQKRLKKRLNSWMNVSKIYIFHPFPVGEAPFSPKGQKFLFYDTHIALLYKYSFAHISTVC